MAHPLDGALADSTGSARLKLYWTKEHIKNLDSEIRAFMASKPYEVRTAKNPEMPQLLHYCAIVHVNIPATIPLICGDIIHNLRSALDHLAWQLVIAAGKKPDRKTAFPIFDTAEIYKAEAKRKVHLMRQDSIDAINAVEPYQGGKGEALWRLQRLNNIDKHNLILTTPACIASIDAMAQLARAIPALAPLAERGFRLRPNFKPLQNGDIIWTSIESEPDKNMKFTIDIAFNESGVCEGESVLKTVKSLADVVDNLLTDFGPLCNP